MILVFGGTTEGRIAAKVLDESGAIYYYSTRSDVQDIQLAHGVRLTGTMELAQMKVFCLEHDIALIIDATHPFAQNLHYNVVNLAQQLGVPLIRVNRIFPPHDADLVWCRDYDDAISQLNKHNVERLIAFTGVNTIGKLKDYWQHNECWFRILDRDESREATATAGFPQDHLVYYESHGTEQLLKQLHQGEWHQWRFCRESGCCSTQWGAHFCRGVPSIPFGLWHGNRACQWTSWLAQGSGETPA